MTRSSPKDPALQAPIDALREWDYRVAIESVPMSLAHMYGMSYLRNGTAPEGLTSMRRKQYFGSQSPDEERLRIFKQAVNKIEQDFGSWNTSWGDINRFQRLNGDIDLQFDDDKASIPVGLASGTWGALAAYGMRSAQQTKRIYGTRGNSFVAVVEFGDKSEGQKHARRWPERRS